jgi:hypothetical protein
MQMIGTQSVTVTTTRFSGRSGVAAAVAALLLPD